MLALRLRDRDSEHPFNRPVSVENPSVLVDSQDYLADVVYDADQLLALLDAHVEKLPVLEDGCHDFAEYA